MKILMGADPGPPYTPQEKRDLFKGISKGLEEMKEIISECNKPKDIGDKVKLVGFTGVQNIETRQEYNSSDEISQDTMIVVEKNCQNPYKNKETGEEINRDIIVYSPKYNVKIATSMDKTILKYDK